MDHEKKIDIPFGAHDSELKGWEYTIPEGFTAEIKDGKVIVKEKANEDEKVRRQLINVCNDWLNGDYSAKPCLNDIKWLKNLLERQKINIEGDFGRGYDCGYEACLNSHGAEWFEKQKEIPMSDSTKMIKMWDEEKKILERMYLRGDTWELIAYNAFMDGFARGNLVKFEKQKEQKPDSLIYDKDLDKDAREFYLSGGADSPVDSTGLVPIVRMAEFGATWMKERMEKEQKPAEWSEEDREMLTRCVDAIPVQGDEIMPTSYLNKLRNWLESLPERFNLQSKQEWSENDKKGLDNCCAIIAMPDIFFDKIIRQKCLDFLYELPERFNLQPNPEWSEEDRPSWKPSDEQMQCLLAVITNQYNAGAESCHLTLGSLYNDLKKLK